MGRAKILITEDEFIIAEDIKEKLTELEYDVINIVGTGREAISQAKQKKPDLVLMDIKLKGRIDGIEAAGEIWSKLKIPVVFLSSFSDLGTLQRAREAEPFGYIVKPYHESNLRSTIEIAMYMAGIYNEEKATLHESSEEQTNKQSIFVKHKSVIQKINTDDIMFIEGLKDYLVIKTASKRFVVHTTMKTILEKLPVVNFSRVHRSFIVNLNKIKSIEDNTLALEDKLIPIGRAYKVQLFKRLNIV